METNIPWIISFNNKHLELILLVTEQCNFRCGYCYEDFKLGKMEPYVIEGVENVIKKRIDGLEVLNLSFFGGEPLLNKNTVLKLSNWTAQFCKTHNVKYLSDITTNGYLLDKKTFEKLIKNDITAFQITLDGEKQAHDKLRPTLNGKSTFKKIYSNLIMMAETNHNFTCKLRFNIADSNFNSIKSFINNHSSHFANDKRFSFHFHPIFGMSELKLTKEEQLKELDELAEIKGFRYDTPSDHSLCYASKANSFVIRADGRIQKCTVSLKNETNNIGKIDKDGNLNIDEDKFKKWVFALDKGCPLRSLSLEKHTSPSQAV
jgi:uncharacterized protein